MERGVTNERLLFAVIDYCNGTQRSTARPSQCFPHNGAVTLGGKVSSPARTRASRTAKRVQ